MYLYFDRSGTLKEMYNPDIERVGNSNVNKLYIYWELAEDLTITGLRTRYKLEDNSNYPTTPDYVNQYTVATSKIPYNKREDLKFFKFFKDYQFYVVNVPDEVLAKDGAVICSAWFVYGNNIQAMGKFAFAVDGNTEMVKPDYNINIAQWNSLITLLKNNFNFFAVATIDGLDLSYYNENSIIWDLSDGKIYQLKNGELIELGFPTLPYVPIKTTTGEFVYTHNGAVQGEKEFEAVLMTPDTSKIPSSSAVLSSISELAVPKSNTSGLHVYSQNGGLQSELEVDEISLGNDDYSTHIPTSGLVKRAIEEIKNNPDVVDIVETKADLDAYDTSILSDKDIIRVLVDETHDGASTFYRWNLSQEKWDYIGKAGDYYTKSEINSLLLLKSDAINITNGTGSGSLVQTNTESENTASGLDAIAGGKNCQANGKRSLVYGNGNKSYAQDSIVIGQVNTNGIDGVSTNYGVRAIVGGGANTNQGNDNLIFGETNTMGIGNCTFVHGIGNTVNGAHNLVKGQQNQINDNAENCLICGYGNKATVKHSVLLGQYLKATNDSKFVFGLNNNEKNGTLVEIANGISGDDNHKSNCFEIYKNGKLRVPQQYDIGSGSYIESSSGSAFEVDAINKTIKVGDTILTESELINIIALKNTKADKLDVEIPARVNADINLTLENNKEFRYGALYGAINISFPSNPALDFMCELDIQSLPSMSYPNNIKWSGDDIENGVFVPDSQAVTPYQILFYTSGVSNNIWNGIVRKPSV